MDFQILSVSHTFDTRRIEYQWLLNITNLVVKRRVASTPNSTAKRQPVEKFCLNFVASSRRISNASRPQTKRGDNVNQYTELSQNLSKIIASFEDIRKNEALTTLERTTLDKPRLSYALQAADALNALHYEIRSKCDGRPEIFRLHGEWLDGRTEIEFAECLEKFTEDEVAFIDGHTFSLDQAIGLRDWLTKVISYHSSESTTPTPLM